MRQMRILNPSQSTISACAMASYPEGFNPLYSPFRTELGFNEHILVTPSSWGDEDPCYDVGYDRRYFLADQSDPLQAGMREWVLDEHLDMMWLGGPDPVDYTDSGFDLDEDYVEDPRAVVKIRPREAEWPFPCGNYGFLY